MYYIAKLRSALEGEGFEPDFPDVSGILELAFGGYESMCGIYRCDEDFDEKVLQNHCVEPVSEELENLITSAERYPPALALARRDITLCRRKEFSDVRLLEKEYGSRLRKYLLGQIDDWFFLAESATDEVGYRSKSEFCWIVGSDKDEKGNSLVRWVSWDYHIYANPLSDFVIDEQQVLRIA